MCDHKTELSFTLGGVHFQVNGDTLGEAVEHLKSLASEAPAIFEKVVELRQAQLANEVFADKTPDVPVTVAEGPPGSDVVRCDHGPMKDLKGQTNAKGDPYKYRYYCAADRNDPTKCKEGKVPN